MRATNPLQGVDFGVENTGVVLLLCGSASGSKADTHHNKRFGWQLF